MVDIVIDVIARCLPRWVEALLRALAAVPRGGWPAAARIRPTSGPDELTLHLDLAAAALGGTAAEPDRLHLQRAADSSAAATSQHPAITASLFIATVCNRFQRTQNKTIKILIISAMLSIVLRSLIIVG